MEEIYPNECPKRIAFSRKTLVKELRDTDGGGGHIDNALKEYFKSLKEQGAGWISVVAGTEKPMNDILNSIIRQIAHEVMLSIKEVFPELIKCDCKAKEKERISDYINRLTNQELIMFCLCIDKISGLEYILNIHKIPYDDYLEFMNKLKINHIVKQDGSISDYIMNNIIINWRRKEQTHINEFYEKTASLFYEIKDANGNRFIENGLNAVFFYMKSTAYDKCIQVLCSMDEMPLRDNKLAENYLRLVNDLLNYCPVGDNLKSDLFWCKGLYLLSKNNLMEAENNFRESIKLGNNKEFIIIAKGKLAQILISKNDLDGSIRILEESRIELETIENLRLKAKTLHTLASAYFMKNTHNNIGYAFDLLKQAINIKEELTDKRSLRVSYCLIIAMFNSIKDTDNAKIYEERLNHLQVP